MIKKLDKVYVGILSALIGIALGFVVLGFSWAAINGDSITYFIKEIAGKSLLYRDSILTVCTVFNILIFYIALRKEMWKFCRGMMMVIMLTVPLIIWFQIQAGIA